MERLGSTCKRPLNVAPALSVHALGPAERAITVSGGLAGSSADPAIVHRRSTVSTGSIVETRRVAPPVINLFLSTATRRRVDGISVATASVSHRRRNTFGASTLAASFKD